MDYLSACGPWPEWVNELRPHQVQAVNEILGHYASGVDVVFIDAPTGAGKTLIAEVVRRALKTNAVYMCNSKGLQDQFLRDFPNARVIKGKANYKTQFYEEFTCDDCTKTYDHKGRPEVNSCVYCASFDECPYVEAKTEAEFSELAVLNTSYFLGETNHNKKSAFKNRGLVICDEADTLERQLMGFVEFVVPDAQMKRLGVWAPKKGERKENIVKWMSERLKPAINEAIDMEGVPKRKRRLIQLEGSIKKILGLGQDEWVRTYDRTMVLKPIKVNSVGNQYLWQHASRWLLMSASLISPSEMANSLGLEKSWEVVRVPSTFPIENRRVHMIPSANMTAKTKEAEMPYLVAAIKRIIERHENDRVLIHTVSYDLAREIEKGLEGINRPILTYKTSADMGWAITQLKESTAGVLLAPSAERGIDLPDDACRVVIVAKVPFPYMGDRQISERLHTPGGNTWYAVQTIRSLVQMTGRAVRNDKDFCTSYIIDKQMGTNILKRHKELLPGWWSEALVHGYDESKQQLIKEGSNGT